MLDFALLVPPPEETSFQSVAMSYSHRVDLRPDSVLLVSADAVRAFGQAEPALYFSHGEGEQSVVLFFAAAAEEERGQPDYKAEYFLPWPCRSTMYFMRFVFERAEISCFTFTTYGVSSSIKK